MITKTIERRSSYFSESRRSLAIAAATRSACEYAGRFIAKHSSPASISRPTVRYETNADVLGMTHVFVSVIVEILSE